MDFEEGVSTPAETPVAPEAPIATPESSASPVAPAPESGAAPEAPSAPVDQNEPPLPSPGQGREQTHRPSRVDRRNAHLSNENRELRERLARLEGRVEASARPQQEAPSNDDPEPDPKNYAQGEFDPKYLRDAARWDYRQERKRETVETQSKESQRKSHEQFMENAKRFHDTLTKAEDRDFLEGAVFLRDLDHSGQRDLIDDITDSDNPEALAQWLAVKKRDPNQESYRQKVLGLTGRKRVRELSRIDDFLTDHFKAQRQHTARPAAPSNAPISAPKPTPTPAAVPTPAPMANGKANGAVVPAGDGYDQLFRK